MKNAIIAGLLGLALASPSYSQEGDGARREQFRQRMQEHLKKVDTNGDSKISKAEFLAQAEKRFAKMDTDGDGQITQEERKALHDKWRQKHPHGFGKQHGDMPPPPPEGE